MPHVDPGHESTRNTLRALGAVLLAVGALTAVIGLVRFLSVFNDPLSMRESNPAISVLMFGGGGMIATIGLKLLVFGYAGRILRYGIGETLPPTLDAARATTPVAREVAREIAGGVRQGFDGQDSRLPVRHICGTENDPDARFCKGCGKPLAGTSTPCPHCGARLDADARFCDACGAQAAPGLDV